MQSHLGQAQAPYLWKEGGAARSTEEGLEMYQGLGEVAPPKLRTPNLDLWSLEPKPQRSSGDRSKTEGLGLVDCDTQMNC